MPDIRNHVPEPLLITYASGALPEGFGIVVASHVSMCAECRSALHAHEATGGAVLERLPGGDVSSRLKQSVLAELDTPVELVRPCGRSDPFPGPVAERLAGKAPRWWPLGYGVKQCILRTGAGSSARLLSIPPGQEVPDHGHTGLELTLVLQGTFEDEIDRFNAGDLEVADEDVEHRPMATGDRPCVCLAATDAQLRFRSFLPRILQPVFRI